MTESTDVLVIGGGNAALCAALAARESGARVALLESAPREWRGGNSTHVRNIRCMHTAPEDVLIGSYTEEEYWQDLNKVTRGRTDEALARLVIRDTATCRPWMRGHGVHFQPSLSGTLQLGRTNAFFMGGGKALVNAYYRSAEALGVRIHYGTPIERLELEDGRFIAALSPRERFTAAACVVASGGFESNRDWLRHAWGQSEDGRWIADQFAIRGTRFNQGAVLANLLEQGADAVGDATASHCVAIDARAPLYDGGICTRIDCVSLGIVVNGNGVRFYDEGEDFWPKRYAIWGRLVARQPGQRAFALIDAKAVGRFMPPVFPGTEASSVADLAVQIGIDPAQLVATVEAFNRSCRPGRFNHAVLDDCSTAGLDPPKSHWALPLDQPPFVAYPLKPGITFTYRGVRVDGNARVHFGGRPSPNLFAAGEVMAGNVLGEGYTAGVGMAIGTAFGRRAGTAAAAAAVGHSGRFPASPFAEAATA